MRMFFPQLPDPESWKSDVPNEGIQIDFYEKDDYKCLEVIEFKTDYHGMFVLPNDLDLLLSNDSVLPHPYNKAVRMIRHLDNPDENDVINVLLLLGFREVESVEEDGVFWKWKT